jgi:hypothetical protein
MDTKERSDLLASLERAALDFAAKERVFQAAAKTYYDPAQRGDTALHDKSDPRWIAYEQTIDARNTALDAFKLSAERLLAHSQPATTEPAPDPDATVVPS